MKNFIELTMEKGNILINVNHIVSVEEVIFNGKQYAEITTTMPKKTYDVSDIQTKPTLYIVREDVYTFTPKNSYDEIKQMIIETTI